MTPLFEHTCHKCGAIDEIDFNFAGPHIKSVCSNCGFYIKFFDKTKIPDVKLIKQRIMVLAKSNIESILKEKENLGLFYEGIKGLSAKVAYWKLYLVFYKKQND